MRAFFLIGAFLGILACADAKTINDAVDDDIHVLFRNGKAKYVIRYTHQFRDTLVIPNGCELMFDGGCLSGPIIFDDTKLSGAVSLKGASIKGHIRNKSFNASWMCAMDGVSDDAKSINEMIDVCGNVYFPKGKYRLISSFIPQGIVDNSLCSAISSHIGIYRSNVKLIGEIGAEMITDKPYGIICVFSQPNQIENSIRNTLIDGITFSVHNDGKVFCEFMHTIKLIGVNGMTIRNCKFFDFWGDAICLSHYGDTPKTGERTRNQNVRILNNQIVGGEKHCNRNGISVINGKNVLIKDNIIKNTSRKDMPGGIDVEPNNSAYTIENIWIEKNVIENVLSNGIQLYIPKGGPANNVCIRYNTIKSCRCGLNIGIMSDNTTEQIRIIGNHIDADTRPYSFVGSAHSANWIVSNNVFERPCLQTIPGDIKIDKLVMKNNKKKA